MSAYSFKSNKRLWTPKDEDDHHANTLAHQKQSFEEPSHSDLKLKVIPEKETETNKWSINMIIFLLRLYGAHENLWNAHNADFRNRKLRTASLIDIASAMRSRVSVTAAQVVQKINVLRATYRYEKRRIKQRMRKGIGPRTKLKWFALADSFLRHVPRIGKLRKKNDKSESESDLEHEMVLTIDPDAVIPYDQELIDNHVKSTSSECCDYTEKKTETLLSTKKGSPNKVKWSSKDSLKFVQLLSSQPLLWSEYMFKEQEIETKFLESLAFQMGISFCEAYKKVNILRETYKAEILKIHECSNYRPPYIWWPLAEKFLHRKDNVIHFVDTNAFIPVTPLSMPESPQTPSMPINPLASVAADTEYENNKDMESLGPSDNCNPSQADNLNSNYLEDDLLEGKWSLKHSVKFLRLYGAHRCLWDLNSPEYRCREMRAAAIEDIAAAMGHGLTGEYVAKKIKIFRITYMQHRKRMLSAKKAGQKPDIQLRWFPLADSFLRPHIGLRSIKENELEIPQFNFHYVMANLNLIDPELLNDFRE